MMNSKSYYKIDPCFVLAILIVARFSCVALSNIPFLTMTFTFLYGVLFCILCFISYLKRMTRQEFAMLIIGGIYIIYSVIVSYRVTNDLFNKHAFCSYVIFMLLIIYMWLKRIGKKQREIIVKIAIAGYFFTFTYSILKLIQDPDLSRKSAASIITTNSVDTFNAIGGFDTVYGGIIVLAMILCTYECFKQRELRKKIGLIVIIVSCIVFVLMSSFGIALVILALLFGFILFEKNRNSGIAVFIILALILILHKPLGYALMTIADNGFLQFGTLAGKVHQIGYMMVTGESIGTLAGADGRIARMAWSWKAFLTHPILGSLGDTSVKIGNHSEILDILGRFGLIGFISITSLFVMLFKETMAIQTLRNYRKYVSICYLIYIITALLNPAIYTQQVLPFFIIIPFMEEAFVLNGKVSHEEITYISSL